VRYERRVKRKWKKQIKRIQKVMDRWLDPLGLAWWHVQCNYIWDKKQFKKRNGYQTIGSVYARWEYATASIDWNLRAIALESDSKLDRVVLHELCHILVSELREPDDDKKHEERVVTGLTKAFGWVRSWDQR